MLHDSVRMTDLGVIEFATIGIFPTNCDILSVRCMSTWSQEIVGFLKSSGVTRTCLPQKNRPAFERCYSFTMASSNDLVVLQRVSYA